jgi:hypothetical protein
MTTTDQIKSLMKSGDVAGAEALCRSQSTGRDVSTKRPRTDAPWACPYRSVASRRAKIASLWVLVLVTLLVPLAVRADIVWVGRRPPTPSEAWTVGLQLFKFLGLPLLFGGGLLTWIYRRIRHYAHLPKGVVFRRWLVWCLMLFIARLVASALIPREEFRGGCGGRGRRSPDELGEETKSDRAGNAKAIGNQINGGE